MNTPIYHIVTEPDFLSRHDGEIYRPANLPQDGFVHCSSQASAVPVANDYYTDVEGRLLLLEIAPAQLTAETKYEAPAPIPGGGTDHLKTATQFPHVYGPIELKAITRVGVLNKRAAGYAWPTYFESLQDFLSNSG
ncbi:MAG: DUF952 domain-containing protein [Pseudomonadota bacterium]